MMSPIRSIKHVVDTNGGILGGTPSTASVINTVDDPSRTVANNVTNGSRVNAIFLNVQVVMDTKGAGVNNIYMIVFKNPGTDMNAPDVDNVGTNDNRKWIIHQEMLMLSNEHVTATQFAVPRTLFKGVIRIPKSYQRNGIDDRLDILIGHRNAEATQQSDFCLQCIYKEFR